MKRGIVLCNRICDDCVFPAVVTCELVLLSGQ